MMTMETPNRFRALGSTDARNMDELVEVEILGKRQVIRGISQPEVVVKSVASSVSNHSDDRKSHLLLEHKEGNDEGSEEDDDEVEE
ncbi:hypothetical protein U1Q18_031270 [Sarracenia purpurea var. burkii]